MDAAEQELFPVRIIGNEAESRSILTRFPLAF